MTTHFLIEWETKFGMRMQSRYIYDGATVQNGYSLKEWIVRCMLQGAYDGLKQTDFRILNMM